MNQPHHVASGNLNINLEDRANGWRAFSIVIPDCSEQDFVTAIQKVAENKSKLLRTTTSNWSKVAGIVPADHPYNTNGSRVIKQDELNFIENEKSEELVESHKTEGEMSDFTKSELQAHLNANKAEVNAVASSMKKDMAEWREQMRSDLRDVTEAINKQNSTLDKHFHSQEVKLTSSLELQSSKFDLSLSNARLDIIKWALGLPSLAFILYKIYGVLTNSPTP